MKLAPRSFSRTVTLAGARERLTDSDMDVLSVTFQAELLNTGVIYLGDNQVSSSNYAYGLVAGDTVSLDGPSLGSAPAFISLSEFWLDTNSSGDTLIVSTLQRMD